jgi:hypothetical protein
MNPVPRGRRRPSAVGERIANRALKQLIAVGVAQSRALPGCSARSIASASQQVVNVELLHTQPFGFRKVGDDGCVEIFSDCFGKFPLFLSGELADAAKAFDEVLRRLVLVRQHGAADLRLLPHLNDAPGEAVPLLEGGLPTAR